RLRRPGPDVRHLPGHRRRDRVQPGGARWDPAADAVAGPRGPAVPRHDRRGRSAVRRHAVHRRSHARPEVRRGPAQGDRRAAAPARRFAVRRGESDHHRRAGDRHRHERLRGVVLEIQAGCADRVRVPRGSRDRGARLPGGTRGCAASECRPPVAQLLALGRGPEDRPGRGRCLLDPARRRADRGTAGVLEPPGDATRLEAVGGGHDRDPGPAQRPDAPAAIAVPGRPALRVGASRGEDKSVDLVATRPAGGPASSRRPERGASYGLGRRAGAVGPLRLIGILLVLVCYPILWSFIRGLQGRDGGGALGRFFRTYSEPELVEALVNSLTVSVPATALAVVIGSLFAWAVTRTDVLGGRFLDKLVVVPFVTMTLVGSFAWVVLAAPRTGLLNVAVFNRLG